MFAVSDLRKRFDKSRQIDAWSRSKIVAELTAIDTESNIAIFAKKFADVEGKQKIKGAFPLADTWCKVEGKGKGWGRVIGELGAMQTGH